VKGGKRGSWVENMIEVPLKFVRKFKVGGWGIRIIEGVNMINVHYMNV
jgi:hypothetical protein